MYRYISTFLLLLLGILFTTSELSALPNPAAINCVNNGWTSLTRTNSDGSYYGVCVLPNGLTCEEWSYYRRECGESNRVSCTAEYSPVCGVVPTSVSCNSALQVCPPNWDGRSRQTYSNACEAWLRGAVILHTGSCDNPPTSCTDVYNPVCAWWPYSCSGSSGIACTLWWPDQTHINACKAYNAGAIIVSAGACPWQIVCSTERRYCNDGSAMPRNSQTCEWQSWLCPTQRVCSTEYRYCSDNSLMPRDTYTCEWKPNLCPPTPHCLPEYRYCSDGSAMPRNTQTCEWQSWLCPPTLLPTDPYTFALRYGLTSMSTRGLFRPNDPITRQEATKMIIASVQLLNNGYDLSINYDCSRHFRDVRQFDTSLSPSIFRMCELGLMFGEKWYFSPHRFISRSEMRIILSRLLERVWYADRINRIPAYNLAQAITREELVSWIQKVYNAQ